MTLVDQFFLGSAKENQPLFPMHRQHDAPLDAEPIPIPSKV
jgi:hypothetical protein